MTDFNQKIKNLKLKSRHSSLPHFERLDALILILFTILITYQPFILKEKILFGEVGIYLLAIQAVLDGLVPYRDFFYLRGPLEIYVPALLMTLWEENISVLSYYFYVGTVLCYVVLVLLAIEVFRSRLFRYLFIPVVIARTFPYVYYNFWGGMRYALGLLVLWAMVKYFKSSNMKYIGLASLCSCAAFLTSIEVGVASIVSVTATLIICLFIKKSEAKDMKKALITYVASLSVFMGIYIIYLLLTNSFFPYLEAHYSVLTNMTNVFDTAENSKYPANAVAWVWALTPFSPFFKHTTPVYFYLIFSTYLVLTYRKERWNQQHEGFLCIAIYGAILYLAAWRKIENAQFEMALQPEKLLLFFLIERGYFYLQDKRQCLRATFHQGDIPSHRKKLNILMYCGIIFAWIILFLTTWGYAFKRYPKRFDAARVFVQVVKGQSVEAIEPMSEFKKRPLTVKRANGYWVPVDEAKEYEQLVLEIQNRTASNESVLMYPEHGWYNFLVDRPFWGRFPMANYSWFNERWHMEYLDQLKNDPPKMIVIPKELTEKWKMFNFNNPANKQKYDEFMNFIIKHYSIVASTEKTNIYQ